MPEQFRLDFDHFRYYRPPQNNFWALLVLLQTRAAYISCFKCFYRRQHLFSGDDLISNFDWSRHFEIGPSYMGSLPQAHNYNQLRQQFLHTAISDLCRNGCVKYSNMLWNVLSLFVCALSFQYLRPQSLTTTKLHKLQLHYNYSLIIHAINRIENSQTLRQDNGSKQCISVLHEWSLSLADIHDCIYNCICIIVLISCLLPCMHMRDKDTRNLIVLFWSVATAKMMIMILKYCHV